MTAVQFRAATPQDLPTLEAFEQQVIEAERPFNTAIKPSGAHYYDLPDLLHGDNSLLLVGTLHDNIVATGYVQIRDSKPSLLHERHGYLGFMYVHDSVRGRGVNQQLIEHLCQWAEERGVTDFYLDVYADNTSAIRAYEKAGFNASMIEMKLQR